MLVALRMMRINVPLIHGWKPPHAGSRVLLDEEDRYRTAYVEKVPQPFARSVVHSDGLVRDLSPRIPDLEEGL
jgi:hypothetical protein